MKKLLFSAAFAVTGLMFGQQITLQNTFATGERAFAFAKGTDMVYVNLVSGTNTLKIYNSSFALIKTVNIPIPTDYIASLWYDSGQDSYPISKNIFNTDDKLEFLVAAGKYSTTTHRKLILMNEDGLLIKDFNPDITVSYSGEYAVFHDAVSNTNKIMIENETTSDQSIYTVFGLPTSVLATKEIQNTAKLAAFPIPTSKTLTISNPGNGSNKVEVYDMTGKIVINKTFGTSDNTVSIDVENLIKGTYFYKIGDLNAKFIKN
ncbi:T9SS type A sorting domain-containing protein [Chryseobacterium jejuense]|uniref:Por secretion system C-terminal sorting domain n=1 Tax=Chryseobacterium jejuense TaxID=445960 RepID=A0A2X2V9G8_CHRJE|nr:T9SS type A sorting domain-containing protein [Chryseobacterium jejuense]SDI90206.1 Por secretion system C-terminal sorting domain-containing protein [Chryseobacterium jejuense]SQB27452.1 Por secretion system C-terminal sorting domain [Chryseobacterium jejuense]